MIFLDLFWTFFKIGAFTFGGGYGMIPLIQAEVETHGWMTSAELVNFIAVSESTPGPFAINISTYVGTITGGFFGALLATLGVVLPSYILILAIARAYAKFRENRFVAGCLSGLRPAVVGLIAAAAVSIGRTVFFPSGFSLSSLTSVLFLSSLGVFVLMLVLLFKKNLHPIAIIGLSAAVGIVVGYAWGL